MGTNRAEEMALKAYPEETRFFRDYDQLAKGQIYQQGYEQAEKDTIERACDMLMNYVFEEVTPEMRDHFRKRLEEE